LILIGAGQFPSHPQLGSDETAGEIAGYQTRDSGCVLSARIISNSTNL